MDGVCVRADSVTPPLERVIDNASLSRSSRCCRLQTRHQPTSVFPSPLVLNVSCSRHLVARIMKRKPKRLFLGSRTPCKQSISVSLSLSFSPQYLITSACQEAETKMESRRIARAPSQSFRTQTSASHIAELCLPSGLLPAGRSASRRAWQRSGAHRPRSRACGVDPAFTAPSPSKPPSSLLRPPPCPHHPAEESTQKTPEIPRHRPNPSANQSFRRRRTRRGLTSRKAVCCRLSAEG